MFITVTYGRCSVWQHTNVSNCLWKKMFGVAVHKCQHLLLMEDVKYAHKCQQLLFMEGDVQYGSTQWVSACCL